jgi:hypothetical protein
VLNAAFGALPERLDALDSRPPCAAAHHASVTYIMRYAQPAPDFRSSE